MNFADIRRDYHLASLRRDDLTEDPLYLFLVWQQKAIEEGIPDPTAMVLATVNQEQEVSQRIVLMKGCDNKGLRFFTNYGSRKGQEIAINPKASVLFPWYFMERQVRIEGKIEKLSAQESADYFHSRPRDSQLAAWASAQSKEIESRQFLEASLAAKAAEFGEGEIPLPDFWGGYLLVPSYFEFWQGGANRLHDRFCYKLEERSWRISRLAP